MIITNEMILNTKPLIKLTNLIVEKVDPERIILFGSRATGNFHQYSDYDLCIIKQNVFHRRFLAQEIYKLIYGLGLSVDLIVETPEKFLELKSNPFLVHFQIEKKGLILYDKQKFS